MNILERIESLQKGQTKPNMIEQLLLSGSLGKIRTDPDGRQHISYFSLSWLVVEAYRPGFIKWMVAHPYEYVVHHIDGNLLNNVYLNLELMKWADHVKVHKTKYYNDPENADAIKSMKEKQSGKRFKWCRSLVNEENIKVMYKKVSESLRKNRDWILPENNPQFFVNWFTRKEYAKLCEISIHLATYRLERLVYEGLIIQKLKNVKGRLSKVYKVETSEVI